ncbi:IolE/MocC family protein [Dethiobacter alkaliphilus]|uniref:hypothetical protein n=1 Tax=Dethiobacter alkaliphilus TaxID=427926 RepID=UPI0022269B83|nr:hypothetical protein [Dethiobacter alkaliphilus]MCW3491615.1 hypothetical protein [Dethiobacter alkaliphilus]
MKRNNLLFISAAITLLLFVTGCNQQPDIKMNEALVESQELLRQSDKIETTASAFDGKQNVRFRLMVEEQPSEEEAAILFNKILESVIYFSNRLEAWDYYNGHFDIKTYDNGVVYEATKLIGKDLEIVNIKSNGEGQ